MSRPLFSVFTPSHDGRFLEDLWKSLAAQTCADFEWVVVPNGARWMEVAVAAKRAAAGDPRLKIRNRPPSGLGETIGGLKRAACEAAEGRLLFEMDHDDWLEPDCLEAVAKVQAETSAGFVHTESLGINLDGSSEIYNPAYGWVKGEHEYQGRKLPVMLTFEPTPRSLSMIFWCPNHARVWHRDTYWKAGGHDPALPIADDHDLLCRTYLVGTPWASVPTRVLYYQRRHRGASSIVHWKEVGERSKGIMDKYLHRMILEWCRRKNLLMLDLGGGHNCPREYGFQAVDRGVAGVEYPFDILDADKFLADNSVGCFRACDFLEHLPIPRVVEFMNLIYRKLDNQGWLMSRTPSVAGPDGKVGLGAFQDPTHTSFWGVNNFKYYTDRQVAKYVPEIACRFQDVRVWVDYPDDYCRENSIPYVHADLMALKGGRVAGLCKI